MVDLTPLTYFNKNSEKFLYNTLKKPSFQERYKIFDSYIPRVENSTSSEKHAIDLGCGVGVITEILLKKGYIVTAIDGSVEMIRIAESNLIQYPKDSWSVASYELPFTESEVIRFQQSYDIVILSSVIEYIPKPLNLLEQVYLILKNNGVAVISFPNKHNWYRKIEASKIFSFFRLNHYSSLIKQYYSLHEVQRRCENIGFQLLEYRYYALPKQRFTRYIFGNIRGKYSSSMFVMKLKKSDSSQN